MKPSSSMAIMIACALTTPAFAAAAATRMAAAPARPAPAFHAAAAVAAPAAAQLPRLRLHHHHQRHTFFPYAYVTLPQPAAYTDPLVISAPAEANETAREEPRPTLVRTCGRSQVIEVTPPKGGAAHPLRVILGPSRLCPTH